MTVQIPAVETSDSAGVDPLVRVIEILDASARVPRLTPMVATVAALLSLPLAMFLGPPGMIFWIFGSVILFGLLTALIHELGHLAAAWVAGFRIHVFAVGPLAVVRNGGSFRVIRNTSWAFAGCVLAIPQDPLNQRGWLAAYSLAGSLANFATGGLALYASLMVPRSSWVSFWLMMFVMFSFAAGLASIIPYRVGGVFASDGAIFMRLFRADSADNRLTSSWRIAALFEQEDRPRDWDEAMLNRLLTPGDDPALDIGASYAAYLHHLDGGRPQIAAPYLQRALDQMPRVPILFSAAYFAEAVYFFVQVGASPILARSILTRLNGQNVDDITRLRAEAAVLLAEGNRDAAIQFAQHALQLMDRWYGPVRVDQELTQRVLMLAEGTEARRGGVAAVEPLNERVVAST